MKHIDPRALCTCKDHQCPFNPVNHDQGCTPCIQKNLALGEIPSCFFNAVGGTQGLTSYFYKDFAQRVLAKEKED